MQRFNVGANGPHGFLFEDAFKARHHGGAVGLSGAVADTLDEPFVANLAGLKIAQVRRHTAGDHLQAMTAGAVLIVTRGADLDGYGLGRVIAAIRALGQPFAVFQDWQAGHVDGLGRDVAVGRKVRCRAQPKSSQRQGGPKNFIFFIYFKSLSRFHGDFAD